MAATSSTGDPYVNDLVSSPRDLDIDDPDTATDTDRLMDNSDNDSQIEKKMLIRPQPKKSCTILCRHVLAIVSFFGFVNIYCLRVNLSVAIVAMVNSSRSTAHLNETECPTPNMSTIKTSTGEFDWSHSLQETILGSFFYGYICTQIIGGYLAHKWGGKWIFGLGVLATSVFTLLTPMAARQSAEFLIALRVLEGFFEGATFPAMHSIWAVWAPTLERSKLVSFTYAGAHIGTVISLPLSGYLASTTFLGGWPSVFYVFGALGCVWFVVWCFLVYDSPAQHPRITYEERIYIQKSIGPLKQKQHTPWMSFLKSRPVWAIVVVHFCCNWGFYTMLTNLPNYLSNILHFNIKQNGMLSAVPYLGLFLIMTLCGFLADYVRSHKYLTTKNTRKLLVLFGMGLAAVFLISIGYSGCDVSLALTLVILSVALLGISFPGYIVNHVDIAPEYAGTLMGISNSVATIPGMVGPAVIGFIVHEPETRQQWQVVFIIAACVNIFGIIVFSLFADGETQPWAKVNKSRTPDENDD